MAKLPIDIDTLEIAFELSASAESLGFGDAYGFLNRKTGEVIVPDIDDPLGDPDEHLEENPDLLLLPDDLSDGTDFPAMKRFVVGLPDGSAKADLEDALSGPKPFRRFKAIVHDGGDVELFHEWHNFQTRYRREEIVEWLEDKGIEPEWGKDIFESPELPKRRPLYLSAIAEFVIAAAALPGIRRIALIGSLTTDKPHPKDADLLCEVDDGACLKAIAKLRRKLGAQLNDEGGTAGADIFITNPAGKYLGRLCGYKKCAPGIRLCDARNCGKRPHLKNDLDVVTLDSEILSSPPITLVPSVSANVPIPSDVEEILIRRVKDLA